MGYNKLEIYRNTAVPGTLEARGTWYTLRSSVHSNSLLSRTWGVFFIIDSHFTDYSKLQKVQNRKCVYGVPRGVPQCTQQCVHCCTVVYVLSDTYSSTARVVAVAGVPGYK